jgi:oligogalacturonide transport system substrate-binding protein
MKRLLATLLCWTLLIVLAGCTPAQPAQAAGAPAQPGQPDAAPPAADETTDNPVTLRFSWWGGDARHEARLRVIELYCQQHPHVRIDAEYGGWDGYYQKLTTMLAAGTEPDIMAISTDWLAPMGSAGDVFLSLEQYPQYLDLSGFDIDVMSGILSVDGKVQALPISSSNGNIMVVNKAFMQAHGIDPQTEWTWDSMLEQGARIHQQNPEEYLYATFGATTIGHLLKYYVIQNGAGGGWITSGYQLEFTQEDLKQGLAYFKSWVDNGVMQPVEETSIYQSHLENPSWLSGKIGMAGVFSGQTALVAGPDMDLTATCVPCKAGGVPDYGVTAGPGGCIAVSANTVSVQEALGFVDFFFNDMAAVEILGTTHGMQPILAANAHLAQVGLLSALDLRADEMVVKTRSSKFNLNWQATEFETPYNDYIGAVLFGTMTPEQGAAEMMKSFEEAAAAFKAAR